MAHKKVSVIVAGSWGTALASVLADNHDLHVAVWSRDALQVEEINKEHRNRKFLKEIQLSERIQATTSMEEVLADTSAVILVAPSSAMREVSRNMKPFIQPNTLLIHATKGFEMDSMKRMSEVIAEELTQLDSRSIVVLSGPSHAEEVIQRSPTTVVVAAEDDEKVKQAQDLLMNAYFRVYTNSDVIGVEVGGALKNIIALGAGLSDGLGFGDNAKAALLTRGLAEISRLGVTMGANPLTFAGLAGVGDLVVTCTSKHSRNWRAGYMLGQGMNVNEVLDTMGMVVEGVKTTKAAYALSKKFDVDMPITNELYNVLFEGKVAKHAVEDLMGRGRTYEMNEASETTD